MTSVDPAIAASAEPPTWADSHPTGATSFLPTGFHEGNRAARADVFRLAQPLLVLRATAMVWVILSLLAVAVAVNGGDLLRLISAGMVVSAISTVPWMAGLIAMRRRLPGWPAGLRHLAVSLWGALTALAGGVVVWWVGMASAAAWTWLAVPMAGALFASLFWNWVETRAKLQAPADAAARLAELQSRIRPHFLFNALNTAIALVQIDPARAETVLEDLAQVFRVALTEVGASVSLAQEIDLARRYLAIEQVRFGTRLRVQWDLDPTVGLAAVPPLLLQPLVENAVRHGVEPSPTGGDVRISTRRRTGHAVIKVSNSVSGQASKPGHGIALDNVRERLLLLHDVAAQFDIHREADRFMVQMVVPL